MRHAAGPIALLMLLAGSAATAQTDTSAPSGYSRLTLQMIGFKNDEGRAIIALLNRPEQFLSRETAPFRRAAVEIRENRAQWVTENLPFGDYAISVFHDENNNGELDSNLLRMPKEDYGFSNDARKTFGPPDYVAARFQVDKARQTITITVK